ncbi:hypothetical protein NM208_g1135 [Fusarium decemcellulare]|uniref:Uncharacterized protein n=1 Tax=Fusarium decemcellulare TaxID=57161 RepID=A0ACC1SXB6_9HYPO|nr:hypothetical protein NM208_g1135 [Fusarium decemcellulare]
MTTAIGVLAAMTIILHNFDGEPVFDGRILTLNAITSTLSTTSRSMELVLFSSSPRRLVDFEYLAAASRGPLGSLKVLLNFHINGGMIVRIGALATILTIALDPFAQQLVQLKEDRKLTQAGPEPQASIAKADRYSRGAHILEEAVNLMPSVAVENDRLVYKGDTPAEFKWDTWMEYAAQLSYANSRAGFQQQAVYNCPSADCDFKIFESLAVCSRCHDVSSSLHRRVRNKRSLIIDERHDTWHKTEYYLPNGLYLHNRDVKGDDPEMEKRLANVYLTMFGTGDPKRTVAMKKIETLIWDQSIIKVDAKYEAKTFQWPGTKVTAQECALYYCVKSYTSSVRNATLEENSSEVERCKRIPDSWQIHPAFLPAFEAADLPEWTKDYLAYDPWLSSMMRFDLELGDPEASSPRWNVSWEAVFSTSLLMKDIFTTCQTGGNNCSKEDVGWNWEPPSGVMMIDCTSCFASVQEDYVSVPEVAFRLWEEHNLDSFFTKLAEMMSTAIRNGADDNQNATGTALFTRTVYSVAWPWIALHCIATVGTLVFLIVTVASTAKAKLPAWKSSELAIFAQAAATERIFTGDETHKELEKKAKVASVVLLGKGSGNSEASDEEGIMLTTSVPPAEPCVSSRHSPEDQGVVYAGPESTGTDPESRLLQTKIRRICEATQNGVPKAIFLESIWPALEESYDVMVKALVKYWDRQLDRDGISAKVEGRRKSAESIRKSMDRREEDRIKRSLGPYTNLEEIFNDVHDLAGIRVVVDFAPQVEKVQEHIEKNFAPTKPRNAWLPDRPVGKLWKEIFRAYEGWNYPVKINPDLDETLQPYCNVTVEIQVTYLAESLYNRLAHPLLYKEVAGTLSRQEEMVIDMAHGLALCYSICLLMMQDKLEGQSHSLEQQTELRNAMRDATITPEQGEENKYLAALVNQMPGQVFHDQTHHISNKDANTSSSRTVPIDAFLRLLQASKVQEGLPDQLWEWMSEILEKAVQKAVKSPIPLPSWKDARFDSEDVRRRPKCHEGTQIDARYRIKAWVKDSQAPVLFWLHAPAGTGKSTLACTVGADLSDDGSFAAGYFFRRGDVDRNNISRIFPTIASQMLGTIPSYEPFLRESMNSCSNRDILKMSLEDQFRILLMTPLTTMSSVSRDKPAKAIIIGALDQCNQGYNDLSRLLALLATFRGVKDLRLCVLITGRPVRKITDALRHVDAKDYFTLVPYNEYKAKMRRLEIEGSVVYLATEFKEIKRRRKIKVHPWPTQKDFELLCRHATTPFPLFTYASALISFVDGTSSTHDPATRLQIWVKGCRQEPSRLDEMYAQILNDITGVDNEAKSMMLYIVGSIASLARPLSVSTLATLLDIPEDKMSHWLQNLQTILHVPDDNEQPVMLINESFRDFLFPKSPPLLLRSDKTSFTISLPDAHHRLATKCQNRMTQSDGGLRKDVCNLSKETTAWNDIRRGAVGDCIPIDLQYACLYWVHHLRETEEPTDRAGIYKFLTDHFLHWIDTLSLLGGVREVAQVLEQLERFIERGYNPILTSHRRVASFVKDAREFVGSNAAVIDAMPLQIYGSTLVFSPPDSKIRQLFYDRRMKPIHKMKSGSVDWDTFLQPSVVSTETAPSPEETAFDFLSDLSSFNTPHTPQDYPPVVRSAGGFLPGPTGMSR